MNDPFANLPFNTDKRYVRGTAKSGCHIYIPVHSKDHNKEGRDRLQAYLDTQPAPPVPETPEPEPKRYA